MIATRIDRAGKTSSFERLGHYVLEAKQASAEILWTRTAEYVVDMNGDGEKVLWSSLTNCDAEVPAMAIAEIEATQAQNTRSQVDKTYHLVISFREDEAPTREQIKDIEDEICKALGYGEHQRISAVHQDTDNIHLHVAINKVHPDTLKVNEPYRDFFILDEQCAKLELKHGLSQDNRIERGKEKTRGKEEAFSAWIKETVGQELKQVKENGQSWTDIHKVLAKHDLVIKPRGAGLVIASSDGLLKVKASSIDRGLSFQALSDKFGIYQAPQAPENRLEKNDSGTLQGFQASQQGSLWTEYQNDKNTAWEANQEALNQLKVSDKEFQKQLNDWANASKLAIKTKSGLSGKTKRDYLREVTLEKRNSLEKHRKQLIEKRKEIKEQFPAITWDNWLVKQSEQGNPEALKILRKRSKVRQQLSQALLTAENLDEAKNAIQAHLKPMAQKDGTMIYRLQDGGRVDDRRDGVYVPEVTEAASLVALDLAKERFKGQAIVVEGKTEFKMQVAKMAVIKGLDVRFANPELEKVRQQFAVAREIDKTFRQGQSFDEQKALEHLEKNSNKEHALEKTEKSLER